MRARGSARRINAVGGLVFAGLVALFGTSEARAREGPELRPTVQSLEVALWPEYDRPEMLVMLRGELPSDTPIPARVSIPLAPDVADLHAVAWQDPEGVLKLADYGLETRGDRQVLDLSIPSRSFRVEYYQDLEREGGERAFTFEWPGGPAVRDLGYEVQVPPGAPGVEVFPPPVGETEAGDGLTYLEGDLGSVPAGESRTIELSYRKESDALTAPNTESAPATSPPPISVPPALDPTGGAASTPPSSPRTDSDTPWWPVYVAGALLAGILIGWALRRRQD
ncbi:MAG: hypothetical protein R3234_04520 [Thermoanaerobaculia bacterium]|nr:hypothetical protein [Thermoanaerobaculia bacterium]